MVGSHVVEDVAGVDIHRIVLASGDVAQVLAAYVGMERYSVAAFVGHHMGIAVAQAHIVPAEEGAYRVVVVVEDAFVEALLQVEAHNFQTLNIAVAVVAAAVGSCRQVLRRHYPQLTSPCPKNLVKHCVRKIVTK